MTAREVELVCEDGAWRVAGIDPSLRPRLWRLLPRRFRGHDTEHRQFVPWTEIEPFVGHVPTSRLRLASRRLARLHPAQIADLVEAASHEEGEEILEAVGQDKELEADVFEELDDEHQVEFLRERSDEEVAAVLSRMASDDAADLLLEIEQDRRLPMLNLLPAAKQRKIRACSATTRRRPAGIMNPDFVSVPADATVGAGAGAGRAPARSAPAGARSCASLDEAGTLDRGRVAGRADPRRARRGGPPRQPDQTPDADRRRPRPTCPRSRALMTDYNLIAMPVVDGDGKPVGVIAVDDVLELLLPEEWRRRAGVARD